MIETHPKGDWNPLVVETNTQIYFCHPRGRHLCLQYVFPPLTLTPN